MAKSATFKKNELGEAFGRKQVKSSKFNLSSLSIDELWAFHEEVGTMLSEKITAEKRELEKRLAKLNRSSISDNVTVKRAVLQSGERRPARRKYPPVLPKFQNPANPTETWAGRGKQPRWLVSQLKAGKKMNDFLIDRAKRRSAVKRRSA
jgi:DNA-binding protein H-NS